MSPKLVLTYFDIGGAAEPIRWALEQGGLEWEDKRLSREEFGALKPSLPNGQVPLLEVDGFPLPQSMAILRYAGKLGGLYPTDDLEAAKCDAIMDAALDYNINIRSSFMEQDQEKKLEMRRGLAEDFMPKWLSNVEKQLASTDGTYFLDKMTVADIVMVVRIKSLKDGVLDGIPATIADPYPSLMALYESVTSEPKISNFILKHKK